MPSAEAGVPKGPAIYFFPATGKAVELLCRFSRLFYYFAAISLEKFIFPSQRNPEEVAGGFEKLRLNCLLLG